MINVSTKIHDQFSIEFKVRFDGAEQGRASDFTVNTWIFIPYSLDINSGTYGKEQFYRDVKSNVRLITPTYTLSALATPEAKPLLQVLRTCQRLQAEHSEANATECAFQVRMFAAIFKSALRNETNAVLALSDPNLLGTRCEALVQNVQDILRHYRTISCSESPFTHSDEYISHLTDVQFTKVIKHLHSLSAEGLETSRKLLTEMILSERAYKVGKGYSHIDGPGSANNNALIYRHGLLKKNIESALYLRKDTAPDSDAAQQISFGAAAGIAMILSTLVALPFQKYLGNYPFLIFIILVIAYIFKDRLKDYVRARFAHRLKSKYYDHKSIISFKNNRIGWIKEGMDFINDAITPDEVLAIRNRSELESDNSILCERTILYRKQVHVENDKLRDHNQYDFTGINDILRLHIQQLIQKMDDPILNIDTVGQDGQLAIINTQRIYPMHIVLQFSHNGQTDYRGFKITATRNGIADITQL